jgi:hypothetical protein
MTYTIEFQDVDATDRCWFRSEESYASTEEATRAIHDRLARGGPWSRRAYRVAPRRQGAPAHPDLLRLMGGLRSQGAMVAFWHDGTNGVEALLVDFEKVAAAVPGGPVRWGQVLGRDIDDAVRVLVAGDLEAAAREREAQERAAREARERAMAQERERQAALERQAAQERAARDREARERAMAQERERQAALERQAAQERAARDREARERAMAQERERQAALERQAAQERAARDREARERAMAQERERQAALERQAAQERAARDREARERAMAQERERQVALERQAAQERAARDREARERAAAQERERERKADAQRIEALERKLNAALAPPAVSRSPPSMQAVPVARAVQRSQGSLAAPRALSSPGAPTASPATASPASGAREVVALAKLLRCGAWREGVRSIDLFTIETLPAGARAALQEIVGSATPTAREIGNALKRVLDKRVDGIALKLTRTIDGHGFAIWRVVNAPDEEGAPSKAELLHGALKNLGYRSAEANHAVSALAERVDTEPLGELVREALRVLTQRPGSK